MTKRASFQRARSPEEIAQREADILTAAAHLFGEVGFEKVSLNGIAREVGIAKSALYRYFGSREEIFLVLLQRDWEDWSLAIERDLAPLAASSDARAVARTLAHSVATRPRMCKLISVLSSVLEHNLSEDALYRFKMGSIALGMRGIQALHRALPQLSMNDCQDFLLAQHAVIAGLWPMTQYNEVTDKVMSRPELARFRHEFEGGLTTILTALLLGATALSEP